MEQEPFISIEAEDAAPLIERGELKVIDVRQPYEYKSGHIEEAILVPIDGLYSFARSLAELELAKDEPVLFVCAVGQRSAAASEIAAIAGYSRIYNLASGMGGWVYAGLPVVRERD